MAETITRSNGQQWLLSFPALAMFLGLLVIPLALTAILSFNAFDAMQGALDTYRRHDTKVLDLSDF